jgi:hypothetical protein
LSIDPIVTERFPPPELEPRLATHPEAGIPLSHAATFHQVYPDYHPFDPSTKWLSQGTPKMWLIIGMMWPSGHGSAWQRRG